MKKLFPPRKAKIINPRKRECNCCSPFSLVLTPPLHSKHSSFFSPLRNIRTQSRGDDMTIPPKTKRGKHNENENEDRLSDLPDCVLLQILTFLSSKHAVQTCILSTRWKHLWKRIPALILRTSDFSTLKIFTKFVSRILPLRDGSIALHALHFERGGSIEPHLLKRVVNYVISHNVQLQRLGISVDCDIEQILPCFFSSRTLTSLKLCVHPKGLYNCGKTLFPKSLNLPALTSLHLLSFAFCANDNGRVDPFSAFNRLNSLVIEFCTVRDAQTLCISSTTLVNLTMHHNYPDFSKIELSTPSLCTFAFTGVPSQTIYGSNLSSVKQVNIDADMFSTDEAPPLILFSWLLVLANIKSLTVSASTLQILSVVPDLLMVKLPSLCDLKSLKVKVNPLGKTFCIILRAVKLRQAVATSRKEAAQLRKAFKAGWPSSPIPDGVVDFLLQNSPSAEVDIIDRSRMLNMMSKMGV